jgi:hypothetical protein
MIEVIKCENSPIRRKILLKIKQKITSDVRCDGELMVKIANSWLKTRSVLTGNLLKINFEEDKPSLVLDLYNYDSDLVIPNVSNVCGRPFSFLLKFNHYVSENDFQ